MHRPEFSTFLAPRKTHTENKWEKFLRWLSFISLSVFRAKKVLEVIVSGLIFLQMRPKTNTQRA